MDIEKVGIIGAGGMGKKFALYAAGTGRRVFAADKPEERGRLEKELQHPNIIICDSVAEVVSHSDYVSYSVPAENLEEALMQTRDGIAPTKIVGGQLL